MIDTVIHGDALSVLRGMADNSVDAIVSDPPGNLSFMGKSWDTFGHRSNFIRFMTEVFTEAKRVLKPGGHALIWALPRTSHWTATALEDAGFEVRDKLYHLFGSGFPKSHNISVAIDKLQGAEREVIGQKIRLGDKKPYAHNPTPGNEWNERYGMKTWRDPETKPATPEAAQYAGYGTALKPSCEEWILCRKPLAESSIAAQVLATGTGGLNIGLTRVGSESTIRRNHTSGIWDSSQQENVHGSPQGRFPSHLLLSHSLWCVPRGTKRVRMGGGQPIEGNARKGGTVYNGLFEKNSSTYHGDADRMETVEAYDCAPDCPIAELDRQSGVRKSNARPNCYGKEYESNAIRTHGKYGATQYHAHDDQGGASRYFTNFPPDGSFEHSHEGIEDPFTCYYDGFHYVTCPFEAAPFPPDDYTPFLYQSKASRAERNRGCEDLPQLPSYTEDTPTPQRDKRQQVYQSNTHPTVKPLALMRWLIRLITPPDGIVLDPFCGSGSTCVAAIQEGKHFIGIEQDESYVNIANARIEYARTHEPDVVQVATKKVKSTTHSVGKHPKSYQANKGFNRNGSGQVPFDHLDQDGMEEVEDWDCVPDCPVRILGEQSGERKSGGRTKHIGEVTKNNHIYHAHTVASEFEMEASTGTAARYFQQFAPDLWTQDMQDAEEVFIAEGGYEGEVSA